MRLMSTFRGGLLRRKALRFTKIEGGIPGLDETKKNSGKEEDISSENFTRWQKPEEKYFDPEKLKAVSVLSLSFTKKSFREVIPEQKLA